MRILRISSLLTAVFLLAACIAAAVGGPLQSEKAPDHNRKGLRYYDEAFYQQLPKGRQREADALFDLAITEFKAAISANPKSVAAYRNLARVLYLRQDYLLAADAYRTVTILEPRDIDAYLFLALSYTQADRFAEALQALETAKTMTKDPEAIGKLDGYIKKIKDQGGN
jgi:tetratricopeptide (TPR) repeat protein